jgi:hypothetical protein
VRKEGGRYLGANTLPSIRFICDMDTCAHIDVDGVGKFLKKPTPDHTAGFEPGTFRMQSGALSAWPRGFVRFAGPASAIYMKLGTERTTQDKLLIH